MGEPQYFGSTQKVDTAGESHFRAVDVTEIMLNPYLFKGFASSIKVGEFQWTIGQQ